MKTFIKIGKYIVIAFALILALGIVGSIVSDKEPSGTTAAKNPPDKASPAPTEEVKADPLETEARQILTSLGVTNLNNYHYLTNWAQGKKYRITGTMDGKTLEYDITELNGKVKSIRIWEQGNEAVYEAE